MTVNEILKEIYSIMDQYLHLDWWLFHTMVEHGDTELAILGFGDIKWHHENFGYLSQDYIDESLTEYALK